MSSTADDNRNTRWESLSKGAISLMFGQFALVFAGYLMHAFVGRSLGPVDYGLFGVVMTLLIWFEVSLTGAFPYAIRKFGAEDTSKIPEIASTALRGQLIYAVLLFFLIQASAPWIALTLGDARLTFLIRIASIDIPVYAAYFCYLGVLNSRGAFSRQAACTAIYSMSKFMAVILLVMIGVGVKGALVGNAAASVVGLAAARLMAGPIRSKRGFPMRNMIRYVAGTAVLSVIYTLLISMDVFLVKALQTDGRMVGSYVAAATLAKAPFLLFMAIANVTLPCISRALATKDKELVRKYMEESFRLHLMLLMPITAILSAGSIQFIGLVYNTGYDAAGIVLSVLIWAFMFWGLLNGVFHLLLADHETSYPITATTILILLVSGLSVVLIYRMGILGAAVAVGVVSFMGLAAAGATAWRRFGRLIPVRSLIRITAAAAVAYMMARAAGVEAWGTILVAAGSFMAYSVVLLLSGEVTKSEVQDWLQTVLAGNKCFGGCGK